MLESKPNKRIAAGVGIVGILAGAFVINKAVTTHPGSASFEAIATCPQNTTLVIDDRSKALTTTPEKINLACQTTRGALRSVVSLEEGKALPVADKSLTDKVTTSTLTINYNFRSSTIYFGNQEAVPQFSVANPQDAAAYVDIVPGALDWSITDTTIKQINPATS